MQDGDTPSADEALPRVFDVFAVARIVLVVAFSTLFVTHAWMVDDAYITLRTVDNFVNGLGLRWNVDERVQAFTHPLWMFALAIAYAVTREAFFTPLVLSFAASLGAVALASRALGSEGRWRSVLLIGLLLSSKAFLDFSSSGLENPLTHLLLAAFFARFLFPRAPWRDATRREVGTLFLLAALCALNRQDALLLCAPACVLVLVLLVRSRRKDALASALAGTTPMFAWTLFALVYYGSAVPNTAHAKILATGLSLREQARMGAVYFSDTLTLDFATLPLCALAVVFAIRQRTWPLACAALGLVLYLAYVLVVGAAGTHMIGRFFSAPVFLAVLLLAMTVPSPRAAIPLAALGTLVLALSPFSPIRVGSSAYATGHVSINGAPYIDTREFARREGAALIPLPIRGGMPAHPGIRAGRELRDGAERVSVGGPGPNMRLMMGYSGYAAGPKRHIIDVLALTDPLLARLPVHAAIVGPNTRPGHFERALPAGYRESIEHRDNRIEDPDIRAYYDVIRSVTRDPLFSGPRLRALLGLWTGEYDARVDAYARRNGLRM